MYHYRPNHLNLKIKSNFQLYLDIQFQVTFKLNKMLLKFCYSQIILFDLFFINGNIFCQLKQMLFLMSFCWYNVCFPV